jgi:hypothetical protein
LVYIWETKMLVSSQIVSEIFYVIAPNLVSYLLLR